MVIMQPNEPEKGTDNHNPAQPEGSIVQPTQPSVPANVTAPEPAPAASPPHPAEAAEPVTAGMSVTPKHPKLAPPLQPASATSQPDDELADGEEDATPEEEERQPSAVLGVLKTIFSWIILPGLIVLFLHSFVFQAFYVSGSSMNPDFQDGDYLIIDKVGFTLSNLKATFGLDTSLDLKRGDVLVFRYPNNPSTFFIKRLIGLPGDRVVVKDGKVTIYNAEHPEGLTLTEPYIDQSMVTQGDVDEVVDKDKYFVMGDNRSPNGSFDSREWGQLPRYDVVGVATARLLPINELGPIKHPTY